MHAERIQSKRFVRRSRPSLYRQGHLDRQRTILAVRTPSRNTPGLHLLRPALAPQYLLCLLRVTNRRPASSASGPSDGQKATVTGQSPP
jgi:hypothetical protein